MRRRGGEAHRRSILDMLGTTPATVADRNAAPSADEPIESDLDFDWRPQPLERVVEGNRSFRWPIVLVALAMAVGAVVLVRGLGTFSDTQARERLTAYRATVVELERALDDLEGALPDIDTQQVLALESAIDDVRDIAAEELPGLPPFVPQGALREVERARDHLTEMADAASTIIVDLDVAATHREASSTIFAVPPLPASAPEELIDTAGEAITSMQTETQATLAGLEPAEEFAAYVAEVESALEDLPDWTDRYLLALRRGDADSTATLIDMIENQADAIDGELTVGLSAIARSVEDRIADLRIAIDEAKVLTATG
jgi:hypothetical protein